MKTKSNDGIQKEKPVHLTEEVKTENKDQVQGKNYNSQPMKLKVVLPFKDISSYRFVHSS